MDVADKVEHGALLLCFVKLWGAVYLIYHVYV